MRTSLFPLSEYDWLQLYAMRWPLPSEEEADRVRRPNVGYTSNVIDTFARVFQDRLTISVGVSPALNEDCPASIPPSRISEISTRRLQQDGHASDNFQNSKVLHPLESIIPSISIRGGKRDTWGSGTRGEAGHVN